MATLKQRIARLEAGASELPLAVRAWLGQTLTAEERARVEAEQPVDWQAAEFSQYSSEIRAWFGVN